jgi:hypothetical protein
MSWCNPAPCIHALGKSAIALRPGFPVLEKPAVNFHKVYLAKRREINAKSIWEYIRQTQAVKIIKF